MEKYFKIGEISKLYHIGPDSLRYYEKIGIQNGERPNTAYTAQKISGGSMSYGS